MKVILWLINILCLSNLTMKAKRANIDKTRQIKNEANRGTTSTQSYKKERWEKGASLRCDTVIILQLSSVSGYSCLPLQHIKAV